MGREGWGGMLALPRDPGEEPSSPDPSFHGPGMSHAEMHLGTALNVRSRWSVVLGLGPAACELESILAPSISVPVSTGSAIFGPGLID